MSVARFIADQRTFYRVPHTVCCAILGLSVSWFYKWLHREPTDRERRRAELDTRVTELFVASKRTYGSPRTRSGYLYLNNRNTIGGGQAVLAGPSFIDKSNIDAIAQYATNGTR